MFELMAMTFSARDARPLFGETHVNIHFGFSGIVLERRRVISRLCAQRPRQNDLLNILFGDANVENHFVRIKRNPGGIRLTRHALAGRSLMALTGFVHSFDFPVPIEMNAFRQIEHDTCHQFWPAKVACLDQRGFQLDRRQLFFERRFMPFRPPV